MLVVVDDDPDVVAVFAVWDLCGPFVFVAILVVSDFKSLATFIRNSVSLDFTLSKAIIYNSKAIGGLGLTALTNIEIACSANRLFNSSSKLIKSVAIESWNDVTNIDSYWNTVKTIANLHNWNLEIRDNIYCFVNQYGNTVDPRTELLNYHRSSLKVSELGSLDTLFTWHPATTSLWRNIKLVPFHQRLLFAHLHQAEMLRNGKTYPQCHICHSTANWSHVFSSCSMCQPEILKLYTNWDSISSKYDSPHTLAT